MTAGESGLTAPDGGREGAPVGAREGGLVRVLRAILVATASIAAIVVIVLPAIDLSLARIFWTSMPSAVSLADHATLILAFAAAALASLDRRHIALGATIERRGPLASLSAIGDLVAATTQTCLFWAALSFTFTGFDAQSSVWIIPTRIIVAIMPLSLGLMAIFTARGAGVSVGSGRAARAEAILRRSAAVLGIVLGTLLAASSIRNLAALSFGGSAPTWLEAFTAGVQAFVQRYGIALGILVACAVPFGAPIFTILGGIACLLFVGSGSYVELASSEAYALMKGGSISALPLFGIAGILLAESGAGRRFVAVFRELFGWFRGGESIAAVLACAVFSTFTGINGVTIVALGGILAAVLAESGGLSESRSRGLVTASGDIGLLIPPSAAVIVYGVNAQFLYGPDEGFTIVSLFKGALVPGLILVAAMCGAGVLLSPRRGSRGGAAGAAPQAGTELSCGEGRSFSLKSALAALKPAALELFVPVGAIALYFTGFAGLREIGALTVLYIAIVESLVKRELGLKGLFAALGKAFPIVGGTLIVIAVARGLSFYLIDANMPAAFADWITARVDSRFLFLLLVNLFLIGVGCLMDIFSAILVISPFLIPLAQSFGVPAVQFGVIFITNLLLGFLTPTVGMNVFLASYTFRKPVARIVHDTWPFLLVQFAVLMLVTYVPGLSTIFK